MLPPNPPADRTYLIVDDDARCRHLVRRILRIDHDQAWEGADGREAIDLYRRHHPDVVIMDIEMDGMDGITATRAIHDEDGAAFIIMTSKHEGTEIEEAVARAGAICFLPKLNLTSLPGLIDEFADKAP